MSLLAVSEGGLSTLDFSIIGVYLAAMLAMGLWFARRQHSTEDFFLGGRNMPAWAVGVSLFASLLSTITYLGMPGEMFRTGIAFLTRQLPIPIVLAVVWFLWIPFFMRLHLTSAYEYLERRFNYTVRAIAAVFCLLLLFGWMSVVVLTASRAMVEIANLDLKWFFGVNRPATEMAEDGSAKFSESDILNWHRLTSTVLEQSQSEAPSPGKRIWSRFSQFQRNRWPRIQEGYSLAEWREEQVLGHLTELLGDRDLYDEASWRSVELDATVKRYLEALAAGSSTVVDGESSAATVEAQGLSDREVTHLNRLLIEAAYPDSIAASRAADRDADMHLMILAIGLFSVLYTTLGGIRAVVWTDVIQFLVLMLGAFFTMAAVAYLTDSGVSDWIQTSSAYRHEAVEWIHFDVGDRSNVAFIALGMCFWYVCTHGSNQVALQRYFTVKDVRAARISYLVNAIVGVVIGVVLAGVGISMMHFIQHHELPAEMAQSAAGIDSAVASIRDQSMDAVFPQFIRHHLDFGLRGMVVAALFAAAMSTIDSGANSVSTIVTVDFIRPRTTGEIDRKGELRQARMLTASMGLIIVATTVFLYHVSKGTDIITLCQKGFNCFLGPLGGLFVLAMFSRRCTPAAAVPAVILGEIAGVCSSYSQELFGRPFSTHLVVFSSWLVTVGSGVLLSFAFGTWAPEEKARWMWWPVVRTRELGVEDEDGG